MNLTHISSFFFDKDVVKRLISDQKMRTFSKFGAFQRQAQRSLIRKRKAPSAPGSPPSSHLGTLRDLIFFAYDPAADSVVVGPAISDRPKGAPKTLEFGGLLPQRPNRRRTLRRVGRVGEIRIVGAQTMKRYRKQRTNRTWLKKNKDGVWVAYAHLKTQAEAQRANELNAQLYGPSELPPAEVKKRPSALPALKQVQREIPDIWASSIA